MFVLEGDIDMSLEFFEYDGMVPFVFDSDKCQLFRMDDAPEDKWTRIPCAGNLSAIERNASVISREEAEALASERARSRMLREKAGS